MDNNFNTSSNFSKIKSFIFKPKTLFIVLGVVILLEVIYAVKVLTSPTPQATSPVQTTPLSEGRISLGADKTDFAAGETVPVSVTIDSGGRTLDGADLIVRFDSKVLEATLGGLIKGKIFDEYPLISADNKKGLISISGIGSFKGTGQFVTVNFKAKTAGATNLTIDFEKDSTADSNLVESGTSKDILEIVGNLNITVQ